MPFAGERVLVTGATGFLGSRVARLLSQSGAKVKVFRRPSSDPSRLRDFPCEEAVGTFSDAAVLSKALEGVRAVFHLAACTSLLDADRQEREKSNVAAVDSLLKALGAVPGVRLVHCSSVGAFGYSGRPEVLDERGPSGPRWVHYFQTKRRAEELVLEAVSGGLDAVIVNPGTLIGTGMKESQRRAFAAAAAGRAWAYPPGGSCFASVEDAARGLLLAAEKGVRGERYILGGSNLPFREYFASIARLAGFPPPRIPIPGALLPVAGWVLELLFGIMGRDTGRLAAGFGYYSSEKAVRELGYGITPLEEVLARTWREMKA
ncbi:MAG: NAD-dependent epimerase/dehydratase family protein [Elusimicrobiota bacterium]